MSSIKRLFETLNDEAYAHQMFQQKNDYYPIKGWGLLDKQSQEKIVTIINFLSTNKMKEITLKIDNSTIKKGYAIEKDRLFDSNARLFDYLKPNTNITLKHRSNGIFGTKEIIF